MSIELSKLRHTLVTVEHGVTKCVLYNSQILMFNKRDFTIFVPAMWRTRTTLTRLNQLAELFSLDFTVFQEKKCWYITTRNGKFQLTNDPNTFAMR